MLIEKNGKSTDNLSGIKVIFSSESEYLAWLDSFSDKDLTKNFVIIHDYEIKNGSICFADQFSELDALPQLCKKESVLYIVNNPKSMYYYTKGTNKFSKFI